jgi:lipid II:glycine glycyltransferase (peptidoglycan interpeptide bridge formation enzyme)
MITVYSWSWLALDPFESFGFHRRQLEGNVLLDLTKGPEILFRELNKKRRTSIRFAIRSGVEIFDARTPEDAAIFYDIYLRWRRTTRKVIRTERISREVFESRIGRQENFKFFLARSSAAVIAGITLRLFAGGLVEYANNSSLDEFLHLKPNDLLVWKAIEWACEQRFLRFSLGGAHRFLREFGGRLVPILRYRVDRTLFHQHDLRETAMDMARSSLTKVPQPVERMIRKILRKPASR